MVFSHHSIHLVSKSYYDVAKNSVVHVHAAFPDNISRINSQCIALLNVIIQHGSQQIIRRSDRVEISGEMQIQIFHWENLCIPASCCSAFDSKTWFTQCDDCLFIHFCKCLTQTYCDRGLSFSCRGRIDGCHKNQFSILAVFYVLPEFIGELRFVLSIKLQFLF